MWLLIDKNTKEAFLKKLKLCMQSFDYKDEQKDVKGKVSNLLISYELSVIDRPPVSYQRATADSLRLEKCSQPHYSKFGWSYPNDWKKHFQTITQREKI